MKAYQKQSSGFQDAAKFGQPLQLLLFVEVGENRYCTDTIKFPVPKV